MRIVSCHIENFGVLSNKNFDFDNSLSLIEGENGFGKSTLTYFIKAMFYGLEGDGKRDDIQNERRRFMPWQGGAFGGSLTFTVGEKTYTVTRFFGTKAVEDTFELRDSQTNMVSKDFSESECSMNSHRLSHPQLQVAQLLRCFSLTKRGLTSGRVPQ